ncbi:hypothetical protein KS4_08090 [Poriferisphaera corsica]|uniref:Uncharacterized protein n=1 Tax=Poriferisphaera corsica TaxID=2528020 RepID=A0A517YRB9_9BACT|nr:hypothetical protein KS4_08090 [Poriferisphaera corsica]
MKLRLDLPARFLCERRGERGREEGEERRGGGAAARRVLAHRKRFSGDFLYEKMDVFSLKTSDF